jgi:D-Tyr-tRNAtyr deacylase
MLLQRESPLIHKASKPEIAIPLYEFVQSIQIEFSKKNAYWYFLLDMQVELINESVTIMIDSKIENRW